MTPIGVLGIFFQFKFFYAPRLLLPPPIPVNCPSLSSISPRMPLNCQIPRQLVLEPEADVAWVKQRGHRLTDRCPSTHRVINSRSSQHQGWAGSISTHAYPVRYNCVGGKGRQMTLHSGHHSPSPLGSRATHTPCRGSSVEMILAIYHWRYERVSVSISSRAADSLRLVHEC